MMCSSRINLPTTGHIEIITTSTWHVSLEFCFLLFYKLILSV